MGGAVKGSQILGQYPGDLSGASALNLGRGRMLPTHSWEAIWHGIANWFEVLGTDMHTVLPNAANFPQDRMFSREQMFED